MSYTITGLTPGLNYYARVSASNDCGFGPLANAPGYLPPLNYPGEPSSLVTSSLSSTSILSTFEQLANAGGDVVDAYLLEWDTTSAFNSVNYNSFIFDLTSASVAAPGRALGERRLTASTPNPNYMQKVTTAAAFGPIGGTFTLALGDFSGSFSVLLGVFDLVQGSNSITLSSANVLLLSTISRRDFVMIGTTVYRVHAASPMTDATLPLAASGSATTAATYSGVSMVSQPVYMLDTALGEFSVARTDKRAYTRWAESGGGISNDIRSKVNPGDLIRLGDPVTGVTFRVAITADPTYAFTADYIPLATVEDPTVLATFDNDAFVNYPMYKLQTTVPLSYSATTWDVKAALEALYLVGHVDVERRIVGNGFSWQITFKRMASVVPLLDANDNLLTGTTTATVAVVAIGQHTATGLIPGLPYVFRYSAHSSVG